MSRPSRRLVSPGSDGGLSLWRSQLPSYMPQTPQRCLHHHHRCPMLPRKASTHQEAEKRWDKCIQIKHDDSNNPDITMSTVTLGRCCASPFLFNSDCSGILLQLHICRGVHHSFPSPTQLMLLDLFHMNVCSICSCSLLLQKGSSSLV